MQRMFSRRIGKGRRVWRLWARLLGGGLALLGASFAGFCQAPQSTEGALQVPSMLGLDSVSAYTEYAFGTSTPTNGGLGPDLGMGASATFRWTSVRERSDFSLVYTGFYDGRLRYSTLDALNHTLALDGGHRLGRRWRIRYSAAANIMTTDQLLFMPNLFSALASVPSSYDDLTNAMLHGTFSNAQFIPLLTGAQAAVSPALLLYGSRTLSASGQLSLGYDLSSRTSVQVSASGTRMQALSQDNESSLAIVPALFQTTSGNINMSLSHAASPRTEVGVQVGSSRIFSAYEDAYYSQASVFVSRTLSRRWFATAQGGGGYIDPVRQLSGFRPGPQYLAGGTIGFKTYSHTFLASVQRSFADTYGLGGTSAISASGAWNWTRPGSRWQTGASFGETRLLGGVLPQMNSWLAGVTFGRALTRQTNLLAEYSYIRYTGGPGANYLAALTPTAVRLTFTWTPLFGSNRRR
jgi:hypothetical protein